MKYEFYNDQVYKLCLYNVVYARITYSPVMSFLQTNYSFPSLEDSLSYYSSQFSVEVERYIKQNAVNMMYVIVLYELVCLLFFYMVTVRMRTKGKLFPNVRRVLLITAHPDDECMFFGPTIMKLQQEGSQIFLLCLSTGMFKY